MSVIIIPTVELKIPSINLDGYLSQMMELRKHLLYDDSNEENAYKLKVHIDELIEKHRDFDDESYIYEWLYEIDNMMLYYCDEQSPKIYDSMFVDDKCLIVINDTVYAYIHRMLRWQQFDTFCKENSYNYSLVNKNKDGIVYPLRIDKGDDMRNLSENFLLHYLKKLHISTKYKSIGELILNSKK